MPAATHRPGRDGARNRHARIGEAPQGDLQERGDLRAARYRLWHLLVDRGDDIRARAVNTHLDQAGEPVKVTTHANFMGVVTNTETGETFRDHAAFTETLDLVAGTTAVSGASFHYIVTGQGSVYAEVGHKVTVTATGDVIFQAGQDDFVGSDLAGLCVALA